MRSLLLSLAFLFINHFAHADLPDIFNYAEENNIVLEAPNFATFGGVVPITITSFTPPATGGYITDISFYVDYAHNCPVARFKLEQEALVEGIKFRLNLIQSTTVYALIEYSNGLSYLGRKKIKIRRHYCEFCTDQEYKAQHHWNLCNS